MPGPLCPIPSSWLGRLVQVAMLLYRTHESRVSARGVFEGAACGRWADLRVVQWVECAGSADDQPLARAWIDERVAVLVDARGAAHGEKCSGEGQRTVALRR